MTLTSLVTLWPPFGGTTHADFWAAMVARVHAEVPGLTGRLWKDWVPDEVDGEAVAMPLATFLVDQNVSLSWNTAGEALHDGTFTVSVYTEDEALSGSLRTQIAAALKDAPLSFTDGVLIYLRGRNLGGGTKDPDPGPGGVDVWETVALYRYMIQYPA